MSSHAVSTVPNLTLLSKTMDFFFFLRDMNYSRKQAFVVKLCFHRLLGSWKKGQRTEDKIKQDQPFLKEISTKMIKSI